MPVSLRSTQRVQPQAPVAAPVPASPVKPAVTGAPAKPDTLTRTEAPATTQSGLLATAGQAATRKGTVFSHLMDAKAGGGLDATGQLKATRDKAVRALDMPTDAAVLAATLSPAGSAADLGGMNPKLKVRDENGRVYIFKTEVATRGGMDGFSGRLANTLRSMAGEPVVSVLPKQVRLEDGTVLKGHVKPMAKIDGVLGNRPAEWSAKERAAILADGPWIELLGNYDAKPDQYVKVGGTIVNTDWDVSDFGSGDLGPISRAKAHNPMPPAQTLLFREYVHGRIDLDFAPTFDTLSRIEKIPDAEFRTHVRGYAEQAFARGQTGGFANVGAMVDAYAARKDSLRPRFEALVADLTAERAARSGDEGAMGFHKLLMRNFGDFLRDAVVAAADQPVVMNTVYKTGQLIGSVFNTQG